MTDNAERRQTVAVVGLGAMGIVTVKNLLEEGFDVTGFERNSYIGGLWHFTENEDTLSILESTESNVSVDRAAFTDFPFPKDTPTFCSGQRIEAYLEAYADHFNLRPHFRLSKNITLISREDDNGKWKLDFADCESEWFDKVVLATGPHVKPVMPEFEGVELYTGRLIHSRGFKKAESYNGEDVLIVGLGNTGGDVADVLVNHASSISIAHNHGAIIMPRLVNGVPVTSRMSYRFLKIQGIVSRLFPNLAEKLVNNMAKRVMTDAFGDPDPSWGLFPAPSLRVSNPVISDTLISNLSSGAVKSVAGIRRFVGGRKVELTSGAVIEADSIICCSGYKNDLGVLEERYNPSSNPPNAWLQAPGSKGRPLPRLYQNVFSIEAPDSLAFLGCVWFVTGAFGLADLASMCIAQVWAGKSKLPGRLQMLKWADAQERRICSLAQQGSVIPATVPQRAWLLWADKTAGLGVEEHLGWGWKGWLFWWRDRKLWKMVMDGVLTSAVWRLFDGKRRKRWDGAKAEIIRLNLEAQERSELAKKRLKDAAKYQD